MKKLRYLHRCAYQDAFSVTVSTSDHPVSVFATRAPQSIQCVVFAFDVHTGVAVWKITFTSTVQNSGIEVKAIGTGNIALATLHAVSVLTSGGNVLFIYEATDANLHSPHFSPDGNWLCTRPLFASPHLACIGITARILMLVMCSRRRYQRRVPPSELWQFVCEEFLF
jgi:outer membrane protein assembly factor BamB